MMSKIQITYFSGYIRNWKSLCDQLGIALPLSREEREAAILADAYKKWGVDMASHLCGMFAAALYDGESGTQYLCRDQVGQKQFFYAIADGTLLCSGDIDAIVSDARVEKKLNKRMLQQYLFYGYPIGTETFYENVYKFPAGCWAQFDGKSLDTHRYFAPVFTPDNSRTVDEWAAEIADVVEEICAEERADTELPYKESFLSGGVDSSYLLAASDAVCANTVGYSEEGFDESSLAHQTAQILGKEFRVTHILPATYFARIPEVIDKMGQPLGDASAVAFSLGCQAVSDYAKVVYSGEGIDEFFGGYNAHKREIPAEWTYLTCSHIMNSDVVRDLMKDFDESIDPEEPVAALWQSTEGQSPLARKLTVDITLWLEGDIYLNTDRTSTACGIELHTPFSDVRLFNVASRIPTELEFMEGQNKYVFRKAASGKLPDEVAFRKKVGFPVPVRKWLADERWNKPIADTLFGTTSQRFFNQAELRDWWTRFLGGEELLWNRIYAVYAFLLWYDLKF